MKQSVPNSRYGLYAHHLCGDCIRNGNGGDRDKFKTGFWKLQSSLTEEEYMTRFQHFAHKWSKLVKYLEKQLQEGPWRLMEFNEQVDGVQVRTLGMKTNNMSEIQNIRVVDV